MNEKEKDEYVVPFKGKLLSKREANKVGFSIISGFIGALGARFAVGPNNKFLVLLVSVLFAGVAYFVVADRVFKK
jgi:hypothetical protein